MTLMIYCVFLSSDLKAIIAVPVQCIFNAGLDWWDMLAQLFRGFLTGGILVAGHVAGLARIHLRGLVVDFGKQLAELAVEDED